MATLARWQRSIVDEQGNVVPNCNIEVRREIAGAPLATLYSTRDGSGSPLGNPLTADAEGFVAFHVAGGPYKIRAYLGAFAIEWRWVGIGTNAETDFGTLFVPKGAWSAVTTYIIGDLVSKSNGGDPYAFVSNTNGNLNNSPPFSGVVGASDANWTVVGLIEAPGSPGSSDVTGTSATNLAIGTGTKSFVVVETDRGWSIGARLRITSVASPTTTWMEGIVTSYAGTALDVSVDLTQGAGSHADWDINLAGQQGTPGLGVNLYGSPAGGTADAITAAILGTGSLHIFKAASANTGAATFNGRPIKDKDGNALAAGAIQPNIYYILLDDTVNYYIIASGAVT